MIEYSEWAEYNNIYLADVQVIKNKYKGKKVDLFVLEIRGKYYVNEVERTTDINLAKKFEDKEANTLITKLKKIDTKAEKVKL